MAAVGRPIRIANVRFEGESCQRPVMKSSNKFGSIAAKRRGPTHPAAIQHKHPHSCSLRMT
jgi:hypothetical protein